MKAIRTKPGKARNPLFSVSERRRKLAAGEPYQTTEFVDLPVGESIDHPDCWRLCVKGVAVPDDDECRQKVLAYIGEPGRQKLIDEIRLTQAAAKQNALSPEDAKLLAAMEKAYAFELQVASGEASVEKPKVETERKSGKSDARLPPEPTTPPATTP